MLAPSQRHREHVNNEKAIRFADGDDLQLCPSVIETDPCSDVADDNSLVMGNHVPSVSFADPVLSRSTRPLERQRLHVMNFV
jgi:hypothetical protein